MDHVVLVHNRGNRVCIRVYHRRITEFVRFGHPFESTKKPADNNNNNKSNDVSRNIIRDVFNPPFDNVMDRTVRQNPYTVRNQYERLNLYAFLQTIVIRAHS